MRKTPILVCILLCILFLNLTACKKYIIAPLPISEEENRIPSQSEANREADIKILRNVLSALFSPDKELADALTDSAHVLEDGVEESSAPLTSGVNSAVGKKFDGCFTEKEQDDFISNYLAPYQILAMKSTSKTSVKGIGITTQGSTYEFSVEVQYTNDPVVQTATVKGDTQFAENGKITSFRIADDDGLFDGLKIGLQPQSAKGDLDKGSQIENKVSSHSESITFSDGYDNANVTIEKVKIRDGNTGKSFETADREKIRSLFDKLDTQKLTLGDGASRSGWSYSIDCTCKGIPGHFSYTLGYGFSGYDGYSGKLITGDYIIKDTKTYDSMYKTMQDFYNELSKGA